MSKRIVIQPYKTAGADSVIWGQWYFSYDRDFHNRTAEPQPWDALTEMWMSSRVSIHPERLLSQTGVAQIADITLVGQVESPKTYFRGIGATVLSLDDWSDGANEIDVDVSVHLPPGSCAARITASMQLILGVEQEASGDRTVATRVGSRLAASGTEPFNLDPKTPLFPTEAIAFSGLLPVGVPWFTSVIYDDLDDAFYGAVRLYINTEHPGAGIVLANVDPVASIMNTALKVDVVRSLFTQVSAREGSNIDVRRYHPESVGSVLESMSASYLRSSLRDAIGMMRTDPAEFESRLQAALEYMRGV
ncbi:hypothetical protein N2K95_03420 [Arthrobacter zhaoxinii]|uniref:Uncharacterized protein n=1 Tax=Arthrobacter zhaoxinii TaxID=2964616 RepID=A0ABY5YRL8_9MICC|nr:hypothetical protein [Arthrobacter zhaoxinii]UWX97747.1 hypothetical protein N2K95_03420 [Arthrobacter zhaoxinii]